MSDTDSSYGEYAEDETFEQMMDRMEQRDTSDEEGSDKPTQRRYSVALDGAASFSVCDRSKRSVALLRAIACFADYEPPFDSDQTSAMFEDALPAIARGEGAFEGTEGHRHLFVGGTLVQVAARMVDAPLAAVEAVVWGELLVREGATCLRRLSADELIYVQRRDSGDAGGKPAAVKRSSTQLFRDGSASRYLTAGASSSKVKATPRHRVVAHLSE